MDVYLSPKFTATKLSSGNITDKIDVFEDRVKGWMLNQARALFESGKPDARHAGMAALAVIFPYFEMLAQYQQGKGSDGRSKEFFKQGFLATFQMDNGAPKEEIASDIYDQVRCGLFHEAITKNRVVIWGNRERSIRIRSTGDKFSIFICPEKLVEDVVTAFELYLAKLHDPAETVLRSSFEQFWDFQSGTLNPMVPSEQELQVLPT
ncbi:MAG: hypothetical protein LAP61_11035 [Acidobacteriia bacterium]|nr:hypothetical protein [Terriglobia bacterium]